MDYESETPVNPLELTLDEIIAINKSKNEELEQVVNIEEKSINSEVNTYNNHVQENGNYLKTASELIVDQRLRSMPGFGTRQIHSRLGYGNYLKKRPFQINMKNTLARKSIIRARNVRNVMDLKKPMLLNQSVTITNPSAFKSPLYAPLTKSAVNKFNKMTNGFMSKPSGSNRSLISTATQKRHSIKACLNYKTQSDLQTLMSKHPIDFNKSFLDHFVFVPHKTSVTIDARFSINN